MLYDENLVRERYEGLSFDQLIDLRALRGDPSDNIPGITGIGEKTAINLLKEFATLENLYKHLEGRTKESGQIKPKIKELLTKYKEQALFSQELATIYKNVPIKVSPKAYRWDKYDKSKAIKALEGFGFNSLIKRLSEKPEKEQEQEKSARELTLW